jgi:formylglycine-generating enzyme required for sulfatase activity
MALVPAGEFAMGDVSGRPDEQPVHTVYVSAFRIALLPVTNHEFTAFLAATGHEPPRFWEDSRFNAPAQPVVGVSWFDAVDYCVWLAAVTGTPYRLPTEAEREKAARGGVEGAAYPWGNQPAEADGRFEQDAPFGAGSSQPNRYGLFDMGWNVHEWCSDWYDPQYYVVSPAADPTGPASGVRRTSRGGAWRHQIKVSRCAARSSIPPDRRYNDYGFRVVASGSG